jgi:HlyD family secretion protein
MTARGRARTAAGALPVALLALSVACGSDEPLDAGPSAIAERGRIERIVVATGTIEPEREVETRPRISGIVERIHVEAGDPVALDQPLLEIDKELLEVSRREAAARLEGAESELRFASNDLERAQALHTRGASTEQERDQARAHHEAALAAVARDRAALESLDVQLRHATVRSPLAGRVLDIYVEEGSAVSAVTSPTGGTALLSLAAEARLHLEGLVDENEIARIAVGQAARVKTEAYGDEVFEGRVRDIAPIGERRQNVTYFEVEVELSGENSLKLLPRMSGDAEIIAEVVEDALWIPETALLYDGDRIYVEVLNGVPERIHEQDIEVNIVDKGRIQVVRGLEAGQQVRLK